MRPVNVFPGTVVGDYEVTDHLGSGHWGSVYAGRPRRGAPPDLPRRVALKFLPAGRGAPAEAAVARELAFSERARHARLIRTHQVLREPDGTTVLVMERARTSLRSLLDENPERPLPDAARILRELWEALEHMHAEGWVHGDLKPGNVLLAEDGSVRVADFGVAAELEGTHAYTEAVGTQDYLPPEWWERRLSEKGVLTRPATDVWAFGVIAHEVLTGGVHPFAGAAAQARAAEVRGYAAGQVQLRLAPSVPAVWQAIIRDCLAVPYQERMEVTRDLAARMPHGGPPRRRRRAWLIGAAAALAVLIGGGAATAQRMLAPETVSGELRPDAAVPQQYRTAITEAAHSCHQKAVTPALIAAMLYAESRFDPNRRSPATDEYGIAMWTPRVFEHWAPQPPGRKADYLNPDDAIAALGRFLCSLVTTVGYLPGDQQSLIAAGYRMGGDAVREAKGVPPKAEQYIREVKAKVAEYGY
ncbi:hypothetical protein MB27_29620 [Actinoplanes utahensis]|uniref:Protein kinase domain-containing protein n=1 Tax=Actinoplanes utahensis TaxID=1869 RepID=A0A0A6UFS1_ACTUT|nr:hypothetical protein MB27_29620 [Actinoplanes utahensis]